MVAHLGNRSPISATIRHGGGEIEMKGRSGSGKRGGRTGRPTAEAAIRLTSHILQSAREMFFEHGFDGASADMIAERAKISKRTLYARFGSKARVFEAVILDEIDTQLRALEPAVDADLAVVDRLQSIADVLLEWLLTPRIASMERVVIAQAVRFPALAANIHEFGFQRAAQWVASILGAAAAKGELDLPDPVFAAEQFVTLVIVAPMRRAALGLAPPAYDENARARVRRGIELFITGCLPPKLSTENVQ
ncbi:MULTISPECIES: TetR/AcrR family transcriptional regulator [Sphingomonas]|uniref:TetR/AcrR family transcriptional regulator n=1 Tax=Sphingomonas TaxID=13687 RepID=UPI000AD395B3|nr:MULTISPECIES: TetR/AcrR family transcriptional regulator [Sphingomonas]